MRIQALGPAVCIDRLCPTGGAPEPVSVQWVSTLHPPALPHQVDQ